MREMKKMKKAERIIAALFLLLCLLVACGKTSPHAAADPPALETDAAAPDGEMDPYLAAAACQALNLPPDAVLSASDCAAVEELDLFETEIASLKGIEQFVNLRVLSVSGGYLTDLTPLQNLTELERVSVSWCYVREIPDLSACRHLDSLEITDCCVEDLSPAAKIPWVKILNFCDNRITSVAPLKELRNLEYLDLSFNPVLDWDTVQDNLALQAALPWDYDLALQVQERARSLAAETVTEGMTDLEKQVALCEKIHAIADNTEAMHPQEPDGYEVLINGRGVCGDFAQATSLLMNMAGLHVINCGSDTHAWNMIELDGAWYEFDCMWDDDAAPADWQYFNLSRADMSEIAWHDANPLRYPEAPRTMPAAEYLDP